MSSPNTRLLTLFWEGVKHEIPLQPNCNLDDPTIQTIRYSPNMKGEQFYGVYCGQHKEGIAHGSGKVYDYSTGLMTHDALWEYGFMVSGKYFDFASGELIYDGEFDEDGLLSGYGKLYCSGNIILYEGYLKNWNRHGHGIEYNVGQKVYEGDWKMNDRHGFGIAYNQETGKKEYVGEWFENVKHGEGVLTTEGSIYHGDFRNDFRHGHGLEVRPNGKKYSGYFQYNEYHGFGFYEFDDGSSHHGEFKDGIPDGQGILLSPESILQKKGKFKGTNLHGYGIIYHDDGTIFQKGKFIHGNWYDEIQFQIQKYVETNDTSVIQNVNAMEIQSFIEKNYQIVYDDNNGRRVQKSKNFLLQQIHSLHRTRTSNETTMSSKFDLFGNEIINQCMGNDGNIYDLDSMKKLFETDADGDFKNIPYHYENDIRVPNFPRMGNGKILDGYKILLDIKVL